MKNFPHVRELNQFILKLRLKRRIVSVARKDIQRHAEVYKKLEQYDKGELPKTELLVRSANLQDFVRSL